MHILTKRAELQTANWAGGTTTQLAIHPATATYREFNFDFRISYATVEVEESTFTFMPGVTRYLMILQGELEIDHADRYKKHLRQFDTDTFSGEWPTKAKGKVMDFNLMTRGASSGELEAIVMESGNEKELLMTSTHTGIYLLTGKLQVNNKEDSILLNNGDFVLFANEDQYRLALRASDRSQIVIAKVQLR